MMKYWSFLIKLFLTFQLSMMAPLFNVSAPMAVVPDSVMVNETSSEGKDLDVKVSIGSLNSQSVRVNLKSEDVGEKIADHADMISIKDEVSVDDEALVLAHVQSAIQDFEDLKKTISFLEQHLNKHADIHVVKSVELEDTDKVLKEVDVKVIKVYEQELLSLKSQIPKLKHKFDNQSIEEISLIVENAEKFLQLSMDKVEELEMLEQEWEVEEETAEIQEAIHQDEMWEHSKQILIEALNQSVTNEVKLRDQDDNYKPPIAYPTSHQASGNNLDTSDSEASSADKKMKKSRMLYNDEKMTKSDLSEMKVASDEGFVNDDFEDGVVHDDDLNLSKEDLRNGGEGLQEIKDVRIAFLKKTEENLRRESEIDLQGRKDVIDPVEYYTKEVKEALKAAKETSHEFIEKKLHLHGEYEGESEAVSYLHILLVMFCVIVFIVTIFALKALVRRKRTTVFSQNLPGGCDRSYMELESVKENDGWGKTWSPWTSHKKKQMKFK